MLGYINDEDIRGKELQLLYEKEGIQIITDKDNIENADFSYLGIKGDSFESCAFKKNSQVYTLIYNESLEKHCQENSVDYEYLYSDYHLVQGNTYLTTEALLGYMIVHNPIGIMNSHILIIGYGNCGKDVAKKAKALQADVSITNRGTHYRSMVQKHGHTFIPLETLSLERYDFVINTVPSPILTKEILKTRKDNCKIYDIASAPYGVKKENRFSNYYILGGLPSKYAYKSAAKLIYKAMKKKEEIYVKR